MLALLRSARAAGPDSAEVLVARDAVIDAGYPFERAMSVTSPVREISCQCGKWSGVRCAWRGPITQTVLVDYVIDADRAELEEARIHEVSARHGVVRIRVERSCVDSMIELDEWVAIVDEEES